MPSECPDCGSVSVARHGTGTEQLERELEELVEPLPVFRLDSDVAAGSGIAGVLRAFEAADAGVLVGTQMVAKGHDFPDVTLGVVLDADATLRFPDFRAEERTFALVAQLAGRSGRGERGGRVVVQALEPDARALRHAAGHDSSGFLADELPRREAFAYPPYGHLIRVVCSASEAGPEQAAALAVRELVEAAGVPVLGPAPLFRRQARQRAQLVIRSREREPAIAAVRAAVEEVAADRRMPRRLRGGRGSAVVPHSRAARLAAMAQERETSRSRSRRPRGRGTLEEAPALDPEVEARRVAAMSFIRRLGDPVLKSRATPVDRFDDSLRRQVSRMAGIMNDALGVGLAAPQLGISQRLLVYRVGPDAPVTALANPELEWSSDDPRWARRAACRSPE